MWSIVLTMDINGPLKGKGFTVFKKEMSTSVTRISIPDVETLLLQHIKHDFPDKTYKEKQEMSQEVIDANNVELIIQELSLTSYLVVICFLNFNNAVAMDFSKWKISCYISNKQ